MIQCIAKEKNEIINRGKEVVGPRRGYRPWSACALIQA